MKKISFFAFFAVLLLGCTPSNSFKIKGNFNNNKFENQYVYIKQRVDKEWVTMDSALVKYGNFSFEGKQDSAKICYLMVKNDSIDAHFRQAFILEKGNITVSVDSLGFAKITGTNDNDILSQFLVMTGTKETEMSKFYDDEKVKHAEDWSLVKDSIDEKIAEMQSEINRMDVLWATKYVNTLAGSQMFMNSFYNFTVKEKEALFAKMNAKTKLIPRISQLIEATKIEKKTSEGETYVNFSMQDDKGKTVAISDYVGKTDFVLIDFWASWCPDCRASLPGLKELYEKNKATLNIVGVSLDSSDEMWKGAIRKFGLSWINVSDLKMWDCEGAKLYAVNSIPTTVLIDKKGIIIGRNLSLKKIQELLNQIVR